MIFKLDKASDWRFKSKIKISSLKSLISFIETTGKKRIIITKEENGSYCITDYDDWIE